MNEEDEEYEEDEKRTCYRTRRIASHPMPSAHAHVCIYVGTHTCNDHGDEDNGDTAFVDDDDGMVLVMVMTTTTTRATRRRRRPEEEEQEGEEEEEALST